MREPMDARMLRDAVRRLMVAHAMLEDDRRPCGAPVSAPHAWALLELREGPMTVTELAGRLNIDRTNVSRLCGRMASLGEIQRSVHPSDRRARLVSLTAKGRRASDAIDDSSAEHFQGVLDQLEGDAAAVVRSVERLTAALATSAGVEWERSA